MSKRVTKNNNLNKNLSKIMILVIGITTSCIFSTTPESNVENDKIDGPTEVHQMEDTPIKLFQPKELDMLPYTETEIAMIEAVVMHEVGYCSRESKIAVTNVILNRLKDGRFGGSIYDVLHGKGQFEAIHNYYDHEVEPDEACRQAVMEALQGADTTQGALYYCNKDYVSTKVKKWFNTLNFLFELDGQEFYK